MNKTRKSISQRRNWFSIRHWLSQLTNRTWQSESGLRFIEFISRHSLFLALFFRKSFYKEQRGVLVGQLEYQRALINPTGYPIYTLRRNIHRIDKGLATPNRKETFALDYIQETVAALEQVVRNARHEDSTIQWGVDILAEYFRVVGATEKVAKAHERFLRLLQQHTLIPGTHYPFKRNSPTSPPVSYEALLNLAWQRRSVRWFESRAVPHDLIDQAIEVAKLSPSACNRQAFEYRIYDTPEIAQQLAELAGGATTYSHNIQCLIALIGLSTPISTREIAM